MGAHCLVRWKARNTTPEGRACRTGDPVQETETTTPGFICFRIRYVDRAISDGLAKIMDKVPSLLEMVERTISKAINDDRGARVLSSQEEIGQNVDAVVLDLVSLRPHRGALEDGDDQVRNTGRLTEAEPV
jgi:hypothetical protein